MQGNNIGENNDNQYCSTRLSVIQYKPLALSPLLRPRYRSRADKGEDEEVGEIHGSTSSRAGETEKSAIRV